MCQKTIHTHTFHEGYWSTLRVSKNISVKSLANLVNVSIGTMGNYIIGKVIPPELIQYTLCKALEVDPSVGIPKFYEDHENYVASRAQLKKSTSEPNPDASTESAIPAVSVRKRRKTSITTKRLKHYTPWRERFINNNINYADFAACIGKEKSSVSKYLSGKNRPDKETTQMFADYFQIPYSQAAEEFRIGYEQYHHIESKRAIKLADIDDTSSIPLPKVDVVDKPVSIVKTKSSKGFNMFLKRIYGKVDAATFLEISKRGKISESKLRELYLNIDYDTFIELTKYLKR